MRTARSPQAQPPNHRASDPAEGDARTSASPRHVRRVLAAALGWLGLVASDLVAARPWQQLQPDVAVREVAAHFESPPSEYGATVTWGWDGPVTEAVINRDLDTLRDRGLRVATIEAGYGMDNAPYLSDGWFQLIRYAAEQARARDMRLWIIDEGKYPSGFAGGRFSQERPDLRMQALVVSERWETRAGEVIVRELEPAVLSAVAHDSDSGELRLLASGKGTLQWTVPDQGRWELLVTTHDFRTPQTRAANDPTRAKTTENSMGDLLNPAAVQQFLAWTHAAYARHLGEHLGTTVLGFRGDEPDFAGPPWTPGILEEFERRKGYDVRPYLAFFGSPPRGAEPPRLTEAQRRAKADYWDVWSELFARNFFQAQADWCASHGVEYIVHLNQDHDLFHNVRNSGAFFRTLQHAQIPGIDVIWSQVYPGRGPADFPKYASSVAHVYGRPRTLSESFAAFRDPVTVDVARWVVNQQFARGINLFEFMFFRASSPRPPRPAGEPPPSKAAPGGIDPASGRMSYLADPAFAALAEYTNRTQYVLAQGRPAAGIAVVVSTPSLWLGERDTHPSLVRVAQQLLEAQRDFDFVDEEALAGVMELADGALINRSGQRYRTVLLPAVSVLSQSTLDRLQQFTESGGRVVVLGAKPGLVADGNYLDAVNAPALAWAQHEPTGEVTPAVLAALPAPDLRLDQPSPEIRYIHRQLGDADLYFIFNEGEQPIARTVRLAGQGTAQVWDAESGAIRTWPSSTAAEGAVEMALELPRHGARIVVIGAALPPVAAAFEP